MKRLYQSFHHPLVNNPKKKLAALGIDLGPPTFILIKQFNWG
jgi:hypothetical protein